MQEVPGLIEVVELLAAGVVGGVIAFLFERFAWFQNLTGETRFWVIFGFSVGLPLLAQVALQFVPADVWVVLEPYWRSVTLGFIGFVATQVAHKWVNKANNGS